MSRKSATPVCDFIRKLVSGGTSTGMALELAEAEERRISEHTRAMEADVEMLNKRREWDRKRKAAKPKKSTGRSTGVIFAHTSLVTTDSNLSASKEEALKNSGGMSGGKSGRGRPLAGIPLPADWAPSAGHYLEAERAGCPRSVVDGAAQRMRLWTVAEGHRSRARKSDAAGWDACFLGTWLSDAVEEFKRASARQNGRGKSFVATTLEGVNHGPAGSAFQPAFAGVRR